MADSNHATGDPASRVHRGTAEVGRFPWDELPSFAPEQADRSNRLLRLLPRRDRPTETLQELADALESLTGIEHELRLRDLRVRDDPDDPPVLGDAFRTTFHLPPNPELGVAAVDMELVDAWLGALLDAPPETRTLGSVDDREFGLVTFLLLSLLKRLREWGAPPLVLPTDPPLEDFLAERLADADALVEVTFGATALGSTHLGRLFIPDGLLQNMEVFAERGAGRSVRADRLRSGRLADLRLSFPVTAGRTRLRRSVARDLGRGDVVLFDADGWRGGDDPSEAADEDSSGEPGARLHLRPFSRDRSVAGSLRARPGHWAFEIADPRLRPHDDTMTEPNAESADGSPEQEADDASEASTELLESPEVELEVRVGRAQLTVRELGALGAGQILELDRGVGDRADLVVEGETVGRGELVEVEGRLGVRIDEIEA